MQSRARDDEWDYLLSASTPKTIGVAVLRKAQPTGTECALISAEVENLDCPICQSPHYEPHPARVTAEVGVRKTCCVAEDHSGTWPHRDRDRAVESE